jgi:hypothetical protein
MSTPFNYELDEKRMRQLLLNATFTASEDDWQTFDFTKVEADKQSSLVANKVNVGIGLSRNVVMSVLFVIGIGLFTLLLMNMISLKPKADVLPAEREVKPNAENYKVTPTPDKKIVSVVTPSVTPKTDSVPPPLQTLTVSNQTVSKTTSTPTTAISARMPDLPTKPSKEELEAMASKVTGETIKQTNTDSTSITPIKKKRRKKREAEVLETIQAPSLLGTGTSSTEEAELK